MHTDEEKVGKESRGDTKKIHPNYKLFSLSSSVAWLFILTRFSAKEFSSVFFFLHALFSY